MQALVELVPFEGSQNLFHASVLASGNYQQSLLSLALYMCLSNLCLSLHMAFSPVFFLCPSFPFFVRIPVIELGPTLIQYVFILICLPLQIAK